MKLAELADLMGISVAELTEQLKKQDTITLQLKDRETKERDEGRITEF
jgi:hypothetical protein